MHVFLLLLLLLLSLLLTYFYSSGIQKRRKTSFDEMTTRCQHSGCFYTAYRTYRTLAFSDDCLEGAGSSPRRPPYLATAIEARPRAASCTLYNSRGWRPPYSRGFRCWPSPLASSTMPTPSPACSRTWGTWCNISVSPTIRMRLVSFVVAIFFLKNVIPYNIGIHYSNSIGQSKQNSGLRPSPLKAWKHTFTSFFVVW